jgi:hypothetical protein
VRPERRGFTSPRITITFAVGLPLGPSCNPIRWEVQTWDAMINHPDGPLGRLPAPYSARHT